MTVHHNGTLNTPGGVEIVELSYGSWKRVKQTRAFVAQGCDADDRSCVAKQCIHYFVEESGFEPLFEQLDIGSKNVFVFANRSVLNRYRADGDDQISCLEGIVYKADSPPGTSEFHCYQFCPAQWAARNATVPEWVGQKRSKLNPSGECH